MRPHRRLSRCDCSDASQSFEKLRLLLRHRASQLQHLRATRRELNGSLAKLPSQLDHSERRAPVDFAVTPPRRAADRLPVSHANAMVVAAWRRRRCRR
eukprot:2569280-Pleurochrysis_carterae.AAC.1